MSCPILSGEEPNDFLSSRPRVAENLAIAQIIELARWTRCDSGDFGAAWDGISSLQLGLPAVWTQARSHGFTLVDVARWMCRAPAQLTGLRRKGRIEVGYDADFCVFAPDQTFVVDVHALHHKNAATPYADRRLTGVVRSTWLRGAAIHIDGKPRGRLLTRGAA